MHETGIVRDMVRRLEAVARDAGATRVSGVAVRLGALSQFSPEHFREHFDEEVRGTVAEGAALRIQTSGDVTDPSAQDVMMESIDLEVPDTSGEGR
jgi:hydrogenase nickel incorporation protein HypA/HybF